MGNFCFMLMAGLVVLCAPALTLIADGPPASGGIALVIGHPWGPDAPMIAANADVGAVSPVKAPIGVLVHVDDLDTISTLYAEGAMLVMNGERVMALCAT